MQRVQELQEHSRSMQGWAFILSCLLALAVLACAALYARVLECPWSPTAPPEISLLVCSDSAA
jgi:hypothetical protein